MNSTTSTPTQTTRRHPIFWILCLAALLWNVGGLGNFLWQLNVDAVASFPAPAIAIIENRPLWATAGFGFGMVTGAAGCILLLLRNPKALIALYLSLLGVLITVMHSIAVATGNELFGVTEIMTMIVAPVIVAFLLVWYARTAGDRS